MGDTVDAEGGFDVMVGNLAERRYREMRPLRSYESASEIYKLIIGGRVLGK